MIYTEFNDIPRNRYELIMADPPWRFETYSNLGAEKSPQAKYNCMTVSDIKNIPVYDYAAQDCILWLWTTGFMLAEAMKVIEAWGFEYKTSGFWVKRTKHGKLAFGTGYWLRGAGEPFLIATKGKPKIANRGIRSVIEAQIGKHSEKPEVAFEIAQKMLPLGFRLELFSRKQRLKWDQFGDEVELVENVK